jgi:hypothetical protein
MALHDDLEGGEEWDEVASDRKEMSSLYLRLYLALDEDWDEWDDSEWAAAWYCKQTCLSSQILTVRGKHTKLPNRVRRILTFFTRFEANLSEYGSLIRFIFACFGIFANTIYSHHSLRCVTSE